MSLNTWFSDATSSAFCALSTASLRLAANADWDRRFQKPPTGTLPRFADDVHRACPPAGTPVPARVTQKVRTGKSGSLPSIAGNSIKPPRGACSLGQDPGQWRIALRPCPATTRLPGRKLYCRRVSGAERCCIDAYPGPHGRRHRDARRLRRRQKGFRPGDRAADGQGRSQSATAQDPVRDCGRRVAA